MDRLIGWVSPERAAKRMAYRRAMHVLASSGYAAGAAAPRYQRWVVPQRTSATPSRSEQTNMVRRSNELFRDDGIAHGIPTTFCNNVVGATGLRPQSRIRADELGISEGEATRLRTQAEAAWRRFELRANLNGDMSFTELQHLAVKRIIIDGETFALPVMSRDRWRPIKRSVQLIDSERVWSPNPKFPHGIEADDDGIVSAYWIEPAYATDRPLSWRQPKRIAARDSMGRPRIVHVFFPDRPGQLRGVPHFAPVIKMFRTLAEWMEVELVNQQVAACLSVFITSDNPYQLAQDAYTTTNPDNQMVRDLAPAEVHYLEPGKQVHVVNPQQRGSNLGTFADIVFRIIGASLGLPAQLITKDFNNMNYSNARTALLEARREFGVWRTLFAHRFCQPFYDLVLEESYLRGMFDAKDFYANQHLYTRASWIGPGWGWVDPVKEVRASRESIDGYLSTLADEASAQGRDWEDVVDQRTREMAEIRRRMEAMGISDEEGEDGQS